MNICFFFTGLSTNGGIGRVTTLLANELVNREDINIFLCTTYENSTGSKYYIDERIKYEFIFERSMSMFKAMLFHGGIYSLIKYIRRNKIDIIVACGALYYPFATVAAKLCGIKVICWEHTDPYCKTDHKFQDQCRVFGARLSDCNVLLTKKALDVYNKRFKRKRNIVITNFVDPKISSMNLPYRADSKMIISVGRLNAQKNFSRLLDIANMVMKRHPDWVWHVYGEGELRKSLEEKLNKLELNDYVVFKGAVSDLYERYNRYSFMVMTSDYEGFPMTLLEGAASGLPLVAFDVPTGPSEIVLEQNGFLCEMFDINGMINAIEKLISDTNLRCELSDGSRDISQHFEMTNIVNEWYELLKGI